MHRRTKKQKKKQKKDPLVVENVIDHPVFVSMDSKQVFLHSLFYAIVASFCVICIIVKVYIFNTLKFIISSCAGGC